MIYLHEGMTPLEFAKAREWEFVRWICEATKHVPATRIRTHRTVCLCGTWSRPVKEDGDDGIVSEVTVNALREEVAGLRRYNIALKAAAEKAARYLFDGGHEDLAEMLNDAIEGRDNDNND